MKSRPYVLKESHWKTIRETEYDLAVLPWGAIEAHNLHLPYGTDVYETDFIAERAAEIAWEQGARVIVLPAIPFGVNTQQMDIPMSINMSPSTQAMVLADVAESLERQGMEKLVVLNGHGGNDFSQMIRELQKDSELFLCSASWYKIGNPEDYFELGGEHAGEMETSIMLYACPELVLPLEEAGKGKARSFRLSGFREKWAWAPRQWSEVTEDTGVGDPRLSTPEKGKKYLDFVVGKMADFLAELSRTSLKDLYE